MSGTTEVVAKVALNYREAAQALGCSEKYIKHLIDTGRLPKVPHMGSRVLISAKALDVFANGGEA